jgi:hypothetical protein
VVLVDKRNLCLLSTGKEEDWAQVYENSFPPEEQASLAVLRQSFSEGKRLLHRTLGDDGKLICFSVVSLQATFAWLDYLASTNPGGGAGRLHLLELLKLLTEEHPEFRGLFFDVETPTTPGLDRETAEIRRRRINFYTRLGGKRMPPEKEYLMPNFIPGEPPIPAELMWFEFGQQAADLGQVVRTMYQFIFGLGPDNLLTKQIAGQF